MSIESFTAFLFHLCGAVAFTLASIRLASLIW